jgi:pantoate--beta-alanine ligase
MRVLATRLQQPVGFVPTMGALHDGHAALIGRARADCKSVVVSIFVNPLQFGPGEDLAQYPRSLQADRRLLEQLAVDALFAPPAAEMYPAASSDQPGEGAAAGSRVQTAAALQLAADWRTTVEPGAAGRFLEGERRPQHFRGVMTVVLKLLNIVSPQRVYFGRKDAQQLALVQQMVRDLNLTVDVVACPTVRQADGLALSSRNEFLSSAERRSACQLYAALRAFGALLERGERDVRAAAESALRLMAPLQADYIALVDESDFVPLWQAPPGSLLLAVGAAYAGATRLIDNLHVRTP